MTDVQEISDFGELLQVLRGLRGEIVEASAFLPQDEDGYPVMSVSGKLTDLVQGGDRWTLQWEQDEMRLPRSVTIWPGRFLNAELSFTGSVEDPVDDLDEARGHNSFLKIRCKGIVLDLIAYL